MKKIHIVNSKAHSELLKENWILKERVSNLEKENSSLKCKSEKIEKKILSEDPMESKYASKRYEVSFQNF